MGIIREFKEFAARGNVIDLAVGVVIGGAFGKIVSSFVGDVVMPLLGNLTGGVNFARLKLVLEEAVDDKPAVALNYGAFLQAMFDFVIVALAIFALVKAINQLKRKPPPAPPAPAAPPSPEVTLLTEIRDALVKKPVS